MRKLRIAPLWLFAFLALVLVISEFSFDSNSIANTPIVQPASASVTGNISQDLLQYEWPQIQGDASSTRFSAGPSPETGDILWKANITGIQSYISAFNGKLFVCTKTGVYALDKDTGRIIWNTAVPSPGRWPAVYKIDETHMVVGNSSLDIETGKILWNSTTFSANAANFAGGAYSSELKMFFVKTKSFVQGWDFSNPSQPPTLVWETYVPGGGSVGSGVQYGDGRVFPGTFEHHQMALNATNGDVLWDVETKGAMIFSGSYSDGRFMRGCPFDNTFYCFNATDGNILWMFNPGTYDGYWCAGSAVAYGTIYALNKDGHLYALDVETGDLVWKYAGSGPFFFPGNPIVADGKVYATTGQNASYDPEKGANCASEFVCLDAYSGGVIWKLSVEAFSPRESTCIAYGNLYLIPAYIKELQMDDYYILNQVWAIGASSGWPMWRHDPAHSAAGQSGPTNLTLRWKFGADGAVVSSPSIVDGRVYFGSEDKNVYCIDAQTGNLFWKFNTSGRILSSPAVVDGKVYVGPDDGIIYCIDAYSGKLVWSTVAGGYVEAHFSSAVILRSSPTVVDNRVYVGSLDKNVYCLNAYDGGVAWTYKTDGYITSSPAVVDGVVYISSQEPESGALYMLDAANGILIRRVAIPYQIMNQGTDMHSSPSVANGMVYVAANKQVYYGINATTGNVTWTFKDTTAGEFIICSPICQDGKVFLIDEFYVVAVDAFNGTLLWQSFLGTEFYVSPTYADGKLYVTSDQRGIYVMNASDGAKLGWFGTSSNSWSSATIYEGKAYVGNNDWNVYCISDTPMLTSTVNFDLNKSQLVLGDAVNGQGFLVPGKPEANVTVYFVNPDGVADDLQVVTANRGAFSFTYTPNKTGNWTVTAVWDSDKYYWDSAYSLHTNLEVVAPEPPTNDGTEIVPWLPLEYYYVLALVIAVAVILVAVIVLKKRRK
jgi:outer membrane protein assembly factor BamB